MTDISPAVQPAPAPLAGVLMGDTALAARRVHDLPGRFFIGFTFLMAVVSALRAVTMGIALTVGPGMPGELWRYAIASGVWPVLQWRLAGEVRRFSRWGWYGAMAELAAAAALKVFWVMVVPELAPWFLALLAIEAGLLRYFWNRRADFGIDFAS